MANTGTFKTYERGVRTQTTESTFASGMMYTDEPLNEGYSKLLVNYIASTNGASLTPRKGLRTSHASIYTEDPEITDGSVKSIILACKECYHNDKTYGQFIITKGYKTISVVTTCEDTVVESSLPVPTISQKFCSVCDNTVVNGTYKECDSNEIHGVPFFTPNKQLIGTFINDQYFFFDANSKKLVYTEFDEDEEKYIMKFLKAEEIDLNLAKQMGFNMLLENPYAYTDKCEQSSAGIAFLGMAAYEDEACTEPVKEYLENQTYYYRINYAISTAVNTVKIKWEWTVPNSTMLWNTIVEKDFNPGIQDDTPTNKLVIPFSSPAPTAILCCTALDNEDHPLDKMWLSFDFKKESTQTVKALTKFSLNTANCMTVWQNRLVVAGVKEDESYIFFSAPERFEYFPFPRQADYLDEPIVAIKPFLDALLVFTKSKLYQYNLGTDGSTFTKKCIQNNLNILTSEEHLIQIVKNMAYFKSGNYYYMVVPKLNSLTGELTIAPVSKNILSFFDNFEESVQNVFKAVYDIREPLPLQTVYNFLDFESVYNVYVYKCKETLYINLCLLYNTIKRSWSIQVFESANIVQPYKHNITKSGTLVSLADQVKTENQSTEYKLCLQFLDWSDNRHDGYLPRYIPEDAVLVEDKAVTFKNWQYIDTGNRTIVPDYKKRFREIQFKIHNKNRQTLTLNTGFYIDGETRKDYFEYVPTYDEASKSIIINRNLINAHTLNSNTVLGTWKISESTFPNTDVVKVRMPVSGKGYASQIKILCQSEQDYALLNICNVYRTLYSR